MQPNDILLAATASSLQLHQHVAASGIYIAFNSFATHLAAVPYTVMTGAGVWQGSNRIAALAQSFELAWREKQRQGLRAHRLFLELLEQIVLQYEAKDGSKVVKALDARFTLVMAG